jgi:hypothetical protein
MSVAARSKLARGVSLHLSRWRLIARGSRLPLIGRFASDEFRGAFREFRCGQLLEITHRAPKVTLPNALDNEAPCRSINLLQIDGAAIAITKMAIERFAEVSDTMNDHDVFIANHLRESNRYPPTHGAAQKKDYAYARWALPCIQAQCLSSASKKKGVYL